MLIPFLNEYKLISSEEKFTVGPHISPPPPPFIYNILLILAATEGSNLAGYYPVGLF